MATYQQRGKTWRVQIRRQGSPPLSATFDTRREAEAWALSAERAALDGLAPGPRQAPSRLTVAALLRRYAAEVSPAKRGARWERVRVEAMVRDCLVFSLPVAAFTAVQAAEWRDARLREVTGETVNREMNLLSAVYQMAIKEWRLTETNPIRAIQRPAKSKPRTRRAPQGDRESVCKALGWDGVSAPATASQWTAWAFAFACATAMRQGEILAIERRHVHLKRRFIHLPLTKNGDSRDVPLSKAARALLALLPAGPADGRLVPLQAGNLGKLFRAARLAAGCPDLRFHDSRREATTEMSKKLTIMELQRVVGHRDTRSLSVYYNPDVTEMAEKLG